MGTVHEVTRSHHGESHCGELLVHGGDTLIDFAPCGFVIGFNEVTHTLVFSAGLKTEIDIAVQDEKGC